MLKLAFFILILSNVCSAKEFNIAVISLSEDYKKIISENFDYKGELIQAKNSDWMCMGELVKQISKNKDFKYLNFVCASQKTKDELNFSYSCNSLIPLVPENIKIGKPRHKIAISFICFDPDDKSLGKTENERKEKIRNLVLNPTRE